MRRKPELKLETGIAVRDFAHGTTTGGSMFFWKVESGKRRRPKSEVGGGSQDGVMGDRNFKWEFRPGLRGGFCDIEVEEK